MLPNVCVEFVQVHNVKRWERFMDIRIMLYMTTYVYATVLLLRHGQKMKLQVYGKYK